MSKAKPTSSEVHPGPGFRIRTKIERADPAHVEALRQFPTPDICDLTNRLYAMSTRITNMVGDSVAGTACTVKVYPGDNLMVHKSLDVAQPGDVIVVDTLGGRTNAVIGDMVASKARHRGIAGFIIDGLVRDIPDCEEVGLPIFAVGSTPAGPLHRGPGEINYPISCGGVVINPGDIVIGDRMGVAVVQRQHAEDLIARLTAKAERTKEYAEKVRAGVFSMDWVDAELERSACPIDED